MGRLDQIGESNSGINDAEHDEQLDKLASLTEQLTEENRELREHIKELQKEIELNPEAEALRAEYERLHTAFEEAADEVQMLRLERESNKVLVDQIKKTGEKVK